MATREELRELARFSQGQSSQVRDNGNFGFLNNELVQRNGNDVWFQGNRICVDNGLIFENGSYRGNVND